MADLLLQLSSSRRARRVVSTLGLPLPLPEQLERAKGPWQERPLHDRTVVVGLGKGAQLSDVLARTLGAAGADPWVVGDESQLGPWKTAGEAWGRPPTVPGEGREEGPLRPWAQLFDASGLATPEDLRGLYDFFHPRLREIGRSGRVLVLGRPPESMDDPLAAATMRALEGFVRSVGREVGRKGATANLVQVEPGAEDRLEPVLRFLASPRAAYVSGQVWHVSKQVRAREVRPADVQTVRPLEGKIAVVTGAARGIGLAIATAAAREGAKVVVVDRPEDDALGAEAARATDGLYVPLDITAPDAGSKLLAAILERHGPQATVDVLVHNAGITRDKTLANMSEALWDQTLDVNLAAVARLTQALEPAMGKDARIVCLSSIAGIAGNVGQTNYSASKAGVIGYVQALAPKLAKKGVAINAVAPGFIETRLTDAIPVATREVARRLSNLSQGGQPGDVAEVVIFLASPGAQALTGQVLRVCGGNYVGA
jgi:3-oxoacyl-[acyl-carrier protein] reductase